MTIESDSSVRQGDGDSDPTIGYRADVVYGVDGPDTQAFGNPTEPGTTKTIGETERTVGLCLSFTCMDRLAD